MISNLRRSFSQITLESASGSASGMLSEYGTSLVHATAAGHSSAALWTASFSIGLDRHSPTLQVASIESRSQQAIHVAEVSYS